MNNTLQNQYNETDRIVLHYSQNYSYAFGVILIPYVVSTFIVCSL